MPLLMDRCALQKSHLRLRGAQKAVCKLAASLGGTVQSSPRLKVSHSYRWPPVGKIQQGALQKGYGKQCPQEKQIFFSCRGLAWFYSLGWQILSQPGWSPQSFPGANVNFKWKSVAESITIVCFQTLSPLEVLLGAHRDWSSMHRA